MFSLAQSDAGLDQPYREPQSPVRTIPVTDEEAPSWGSPSPKSNTTSPTTVSKSTVPPFGAGGAARTMNGSISGKPLYETVGEDGTVIFCKLDNKTVTVQFYPHAVVVREKYKKCCFPSSKSMYVIPRYKLTDIQVGSGPRSAPAYAYFLFFISLVMIAFGAISSECEGGAVVEGETTSGCSLTGGGMALLIFGIILFLVSVAIFSYFMKGKDNYYILQYSSGRKYSWLSAAAEIHLECNEKPNEDFLYRYVYEAVETTKDPQFLHRFSHLNRAGLMDPVTDKKTPDELGTAQHASV